MYEDLIMDHIKNARHYRVLDEANRTGHGSNPLCGDDVNVYLRISDDAVAEVAFQCECCGVSMASASIMSEMLTGLSVDEARIAARDFVKALEAHTGEPQASHSEAQEALLATVREYPARTGCAILPWTTLETALDGQDGTPGV